MPRSATSTTSSAGSLVGLDVRVAHDLREFLRLALDERGVILGRGADGLAPERDQRLSRRRLGGGALERGVYVGDDLGGCAGRGEDAVPLRGVELDAVLVERRHIRQRSA